MSQSDRSKIKVNSESIRNHTQKFIKQHRTELERWLIQGNQAEYMYNMEELMLFPDIFITFINERIHSQPMAYFDYLELMYLGNVNPNKTVIDFEEQLDINEFCVGLGFIADLCCYTIFFGKNKGSHMYDRYSDLFTNIASRVLYSDDDYVRRCMMRYTFEVQEFTVHEVVRYYREISRTYDAEFSSAWRVKHKLKPLKETDPKKYGNISAIASRLNISIPVARKCKKIEGLLDKLLVGIDR